MPGGGSDVQEVAEPMKLIDADKLKIDMEQKVFCGDGTYKTFGYSAEQVHSQPTIALPPNDPLTLEQLREMDGEPVWVESCRNTKNGKYVIFDGYDQVLHCLRVIGGGLFDCTVMGKSWLAYRRRPEDGAI